MISPGHYQKNIVTLTIPAILIVIILVYRYNNLDIMGENQAQLSKKEDVVSNVLLTKYHEQLCEMDREHVKELQNFNATLPKIPKTFQAMISSKTADYINDFLHKFVQTPQHSYCNSMQKFGGKFHPICKFTDGAKFVCMDSILKDIDNDECLIYSFGVAEDWTFEDIMGSLGCKVYAFDPSVEYPKQRSKNIFFTKMGVADKADSQNTSKTLFGDFGIGLPCRIIGYGMGVARIYRAFLLIRNVYHHGSGKQAVEAPDRGAVV